MRYTRRDFLKGSAAAAASGSIAGCSLFRKTPPDPAQAWQCSTITTGDENAYDYVIVGSGAGGGPLAANLARAGYTVLLLEAGGDPHEGANGGENLNYAVPLFHGRASEDPLLSWNYFVRHFADEAQAQRDSKYVAQNHGVLYPRAGTLGGCTAHNAMITIAPHNSDWDAIAKRFDDSSWDSTAMRQYFRRMERCQYASVFDFSNKTDHGFEGWLTTEKPDPRLLFRDHTMLKAVERAMKESFSQGAGGKRQLFRYKLDPNDWRAVKAAEEGPFVTPLATLRGRRRGTRDYLREVEKQCKERLIIRTHALATQILFDDHSRAIGVAYLQGERLYRASATAGASAGVEKHARARKEVILCAGAFNSPQLLKLSGVGPREELERLGIAVRVDLPGVGRNLQDRYEVGVISRMRDPFTLVQDCAFGDPKVARDPCLVQWEKHRGVYTSNGAVLGIMKRSSEDKPVPDLFVFGLPGYFKGYYPGYSEAISLHQDRFTWAVLKAHTENTEGQVTLRSADPRDVPDINFHYFEEGSDARGEDLDAVIRGIDFVRNLNRRMGQVVKQEEWPGAHVQSREGLSSFVRNEAWGHHASCTNAMGRAEDRFSVVDGRLRVHGTKGLRVVDASVFPRIPGFFIVCAVYMVSEKATDMILADANR